jgi:putative transcriptional regulator
MRFIEGRLAVSPANQEGVMRMFVLLLATFFIPFPLARAADTQKAPVVLVATADGADAFGEAVVLAVPIGDDRHVGFVLNEPGEAALAALLPDEDTGKHANDIVFRGGPEIPNGLFALVRRRGDAGPGLRRITPELALALRAEQVDTIIRDPASETRFFVGAMLWGPGVLDAEVDAGAWRVMRADAKLVMSADPANLWRRLSERPCFREAAAKNGIRPAVDESCTSMSRARASRAPARGRKG